MMMLEEVLNDVQAECKKFFAETHASSASAVEALKPIFKAANRAIAAAGLTTGASMHGLALEIYSGHKDSGPFRQVLKIILGSDGRLLVEQRVTCTDGCHTYAAHIQEIKHEDLGHFGVSPKELVQNIMGSLKDASTSVSALGRSQRN